MTESALKLARVAAMCLFVAATAAWAHQIHLAGCTADLKSGTWGNPALALEIESRAVLFGLLASGMLGIALALTATPGAIANRTFRFFAGAVVCFGILLVAGIYIEAQSTASCALIPPPAGSQ